jgi:hypothetical protein
VSGASDSSGSVLGAAARFGVASGATSSVGVVFGSIQVLGSCVGLSTSSGSVVGTVPTPPTPPPPTPEPGGGGSSPFFREPMPQLQPQPLPRPPLRLNGRTSGRQRSVGNARGSIVLQTVIQAAQTSNGYALGVRWPDDFELDRRARVALEDELITLNLL